MEIRKKIEKKKEEKKEKDCFQILVEAQKQKLDIKTDLTNIIIHDTTGKIRFGCQISKYTSSCGSVQIQNGMFNTYTKNIKQAFSKKQREEVLKTIFETHPANHFNHYYFIDESKDGYLEQMFDDLGFKLVDEYCNYNTSNIVNMWSLVRWNEDEVDTMLDNEEDENDNHLDEEDYGVF